MQESEEIFWSGLRHQVLARFFMFSHSIFFDSTNDSFATVGKQSNYITAKLSLALCVNIQLITFVVKRGPDHYFKTQHEDADAATTKQLFFQLAGKTKADIVLEPSDDDTTSVMVNKDFEILLMLIRGVESTFSAPPSKTVCS